MNRLKLLTLAVIAVVTLSACHQAPVYFSDGSWLWNVSTHDTGSGGDPHSTMFGCVEITGSSCTVDGNDFMTGTACLFSPSPCKGLGGIKPPNDEHTGHTISHTGSWVYLTQYPSGSGPNSTTTGCLDDNPAGSNNWVC